MPIHEDKVHDYAPLQDLLGYTLDHNVLRSSLKRYRDLAERLASLRRRGWARPREVEQIIGKFTNAFLLERSALSVFSSVYAFARRLGDRCARVWKSVLRELQMALDLLPLVRADLSRQVVFLLFQTDASGSGDAGVYTEAVDPALLRAECMRPRRDFDHDFNHEPWSAQRSLSAAFDAPTTAAAWKVAFRSRYNSGPEDVYVREVDQHINVKEAAAIVKAARWAFRSRRTRHCRLVVQSDSAVATVTKTSGPQKQTYVILRTNVGPEVVYS